MPARKQASVKKASAPVRMINAKSVNVPGYSHAVRADMYEAMLKTMMKVLPRKSPGLTQAEMWNALAAAAPKDLFPNRGKVGWWMKTVQLDLEARRKLVREKTRPLRWHLPR